MMRGFVERGLIFDKDKSFFWKKKPGGHPFWTAGLFQNNLRCFLQNILRGTLERGLISEKRRVFFEK